MKICLYTDTFFPWIGGAEIVLDNLCRELLKLQQVVVVLAPRANGASNMASPYEVVRYRKPFSKRFGTRLILPRLIALHRQHRFDVIHCHSCYPQAYVALELRKFFDVPIELIANNRFLRPLLSNCRQTHRLQPVPPTRWLSCAWSDSTPVHPRLSPAENSGPSMLIESAGQGHSAL